MKMRFMTAVWLSLVLLASGLTAAWTDDPNASIVQGSAIGTPLSVTGSVTSTVTGSVTTNQGTAGASPWLVDVNNWLPYPWQMTFNGVAQPVTAAQSGSWTVGISGTPIILSSQSGAWTVGVNNFPSSFGVTQGTNPWTISGTVTTNQGTSPWLIGGTLTTNVGPPGANNLGTLSATANVSAPTFTEGNQVALSTDLSGNLRVVTTGGNTVTQGTSPWIVGFNGVAQPVTVGNFPVTQTVAGTVTANQGTSPWIVDGSAHTQPVSGTVTANAGSGTFTVGGTVTANQGTTPWVVDGSGAIQPVSGTVTANAGSGTFTVGGTVTANAGTGTFTVDGSGHTQPVSGTVTANAGTGTFTVGGTVTANAGTGTFTVDGSGHTQPVSGTFWQATQPISGTVTANQGGAPWSSVGTLTNNNAAPSTNHVGTLSAKATAAAPTWTEGNEVTLSTDLGGSQRVSVTNTPTVTANAGSGTFTVGGTVTANAGSGTFTVDGSGHTQPVSGTVAATQSGTWTVQPGNTANTTAWKVDGSAVTQPVSGTFWQATQPISGTVTANAGTGTFTVGGTVTSNAGTGTFTVGGVAAHGASISGNPNRIGGRAVNADITQVTNGQTTDLLADLAGKLVVLPYTFPENFESGATGNIVDTSATSVIAAPSTGIRNYITQLTVINSHATVNTWVNIKDGASGSTFYTVYCQNSGGGASITLPVPLRQTAATALVATCETTGANVRVSASGYKAP